MSVTANRYMNSQLSCPNMDRPIIYRVQNGDTLSDIASKCGIYDQNDSNGYSSMLPTGPGAVITDPNIIHPGNPVCVPYTCSLAMDRCESLTTVGQYESFYSIAQRLNVNYNNLKQMNPQILDYNQIYPGQVLCVRRR